MTTSFEIPETDRLLDLATVLGQQNDFNELIRITTLKAVEILRADIVSISVLNPSTQDTIKTIAREGREVDDKRVHLLQTNVVGWALKHKEPFFATDISADTRFAQGLFQNSTIRSVVCVPMHSARTISGHILAMNRIGSRAFDDRDRQVIQYLAAVAAPFLSNSQYLQKYFEAHLPESALLSRYEQMGLLGRSRKFKELLRAIDAAAQCDVRVFLEGKSGTGKELIARAIHRLSARGNYPFVAIDCGAIPTNLMESELFGHVKGAFTGASQHRKGLIEEADHGTLFMDEITNLPHDMQAKLLRVLQEGEVRAVGSNQTRKVDVRIVAASSRPVLEAVEGKTFREDLFYRLHVYPVAVPTLNERADDIPLLANHFLRQFAARQQKNAESFDPPMMRFIHDRRWAGNVRELENFVERLVTWAPPEVRSLDQTILPREFQKEFRLLSTTQPARTERKPLQRSLDEFEEQIIRAALSENDWNQSEAARALAISERTMRYKMKRLKIQSPT